MNNVYLPTTLRKRRGTILIIAEPVTIRKFEYWQMQSTSSTPLINEAMYRVYGTGTFDYFYYTL